MTREQLINKTLREKYKAKPVEFTTKEMVEKVFEQPMNKTFIKILGFCHKKEKVIPVIRNYIQSLVSDGKIIDRYKELRIASEIVYNRFVEMGLVK